MAQGTSHGVTFEEIHELLTPDGRVLMFQIPPALTGVPTAWKGHFYGRNGESLGPLSLVEIEQIRGQVACEDWSAGICKDARVDDLDPDAVDFARKQYRAKHPHLAGEVDAWDVQTFLNKAKVCVGGRVARAALVLLGRAESERFLSPSVARITWVLKDASGADKSYQHFGPPLILAVDEVFDKVRNLTYRYMPDESLFPTEVTQYDPWVIRETLHNCIAHQDYTLAGRINIVEFDDSLLFTNLGSFLPGSIEAVIRRDAPPDVYRNRLLADAMVVFNMIDTIGSGIKRMFTTQRQRNFPMPDYDLSEPGRVEVRIPGRVLDERYTRMLIVRTDLDLTDVISLDKVQKGRPLTDTEFKALKSKRLVEGRRPNLFVSAEIAAATETKADYIRKRAFDKEHYKKLITGYLEKFGEASRADLDGLLLGKLSDALGDEQKQTFVRNLLQEMRQEGTIESVGARRWAKWVLSNPSLKVGT
jgi:ATP-dependent DNA helicase RecG